MKYVVTFFLGLFAGSLIALLLAPMTGEELRTNIKTTTGEQYAKAKDGIQTGVKGVQDGVNRITTSLKKPVGEPETTMSVN